jgi:hypothetical protein
LGHYFCGFDCCIGPVKVDVEGIVGQEISLALDSQGLAHLSYLDDDNSAIKYASWKGDQWEIEQVEKFGISGSTALVVDQMDQVHVTYLANGNIKYAKRVGSSWTSELLASEQWSMRLGLAVDSLQTPHIIYDSNSLMYAIKNNDEWQMTTIADGEEIIYSGALALDSNELPHTCFEENADLVYAYYNGQEWISQIVEVAAPDSFGVAATCALALDTWDRVHIVHYDFENDFIKYAHWPRGEHDWHQETLVSGEPTSQHIAIQVEDYVPYSYFLHIAYYDHFNKDLVYTRWDPYTYLDFQIIDDNGNVGEWPSIALDSAKNAHIAYFNSVAKDLQILVVPKPLDW